MVQSAPSALPQPMRGSRRSRIARQVAIFHRKTSIVAATAMRLSASGRHWPALVRPCFGAFNEYPTGHLRATVRQISPRGSAIAHLRVPVVLVHVARRDGLAVLPRFHPVARVSTLKAPSRTIDDAGLCL